MALPGSEGDNGATFALEDEDHTLANALRFMLNKNPRVTFCGYSIPHPSEPVVNIRVQTTGEISPTQALAEAAANLKQVCGHVKAVFQEQVAAHEQQQQAKQPADMQE